MPWWQDCHDVDMLRGVYKYGFGNYQQIKDDPRLSWLEMSDKVWPPPEKITIRFKKLLAEFHKPRNFKEVPKELHTGLTIMQKIDVILQLLDRPMPSTT
jgi:hypothetical protein